MNGRCYAQYIRFPSVMLQDTDTAWDPSVGSPMDLLPVSTALTASFLIKRYELDSKSYHMHQDMFIFPLSLVMLEGKNPVLTLLAKVPAVTRQRIAAHHCRHKPQQSYCAMEQQMVRPQACKPIPASQTQVVWPWHGTATAAGEKFTTDTGFFFYFLLFVNETSAGNVCWFTSKVKN